MAAKVKETSRAQFIAASLFLTTLDALESLPSFGVSLDSDELLRAAKRPYLNSVEDFRNGLEWFKPFAETVGLGSILEQTQAASPAGFRLKSRALSNRLFQKLESKDAELRSIFGSGAEIQAARTMLSVNKVAETDPSMAIKMAAETRLVMPGRPSLSRIWVRGVAKAIGELSSFEERVDEVAQAQQLGREIRDIAVEQASAPVEKLQELAEQKAQLVDQVEALAGNSADPESVLSTAAVAAVPKEDHPSSKTSISQRLGLSPSQEKALLAEGKVLIAAGAGSGKTRVLAAKVVYIIQELGVGSNEVIATSFSRKSAAELKERVLSYGGPTIFNNGDSGFGTTHSVAGKILGDFAPSFSMRPNVMRPQKGQINQARLLKTAIAQVQMKPAEDRTVVEPDPVGFFDGLLDSMTSGVAVSGEEVSEVTRALQMGYLKALDAVQGLTNWAVGQGIKAPWVTSNLKIIADLRGKSPDSLTPSEVLDFRKITGRDAAKKALARNGLEGFDVPDSTKTASVSKKAWVTYKFDDVPANQYFNLGVKRLEDEKGRPVGHKRIATAISSMKGNMISPTEAWRDAKASGDGLEMAAVYGAYEWLKANDHSLGQPVDYDDLLLEACKVLIGNKKAREALQAKFKHVLVDEAQDQNSTQDLMFGLIAGYLDPSTRKPFGDGRMTAKSYALIGDSSQAIYEFRGAEPDLFINKSDLVGEGEGEFKTILLDTNYRSGAAIVEAANKLIAHNARQVPMVCNANVEKNGMGVINSQPVYDQSEGAAFTVDRIDALREQIGLLGSDKKPNFGIAVRTNAEVNEFAMGLLRRQIPFRCKVDLFGGLAVKSLLYWAELATKPPVPRMNEIILNAYKMPRFGLDDVFATQTQKMAGRIGKQYKSYLSMLFDNYKNVYTGDQWRRNDKVLTYLETIDDMIQATGSASEILDKVLEIQGSSGSFIESLVKDVKNDPEMNDLLFSETGQSPTEEEIRTLALAPVKVFLDLAKSPSFADIGPFMTYMTELQDMAKKRHKGDDPAAEDFADPAVVIDTVHGWKGLECRHLFVPMESGVFPSKQSIDAAEAGDDTKLASERRLAYVAITRGQESVTILSPMMSSKTGKPVAPSQFLEEACISPLGIDQTTSDLDTDRVLKTSSDDGYDDGVFDSLFPEDELPSDILNDVWGL